MHLPSKKESQALHDALAIAAHKRKQLLAANKEKARALLSAISLSQVVSVTEKKNNVNT